MPRVLPPRSATPEPSREAKIAGLRQELDYAKAAGRPTDPIEAELARLTGESRRPRRPAKRTATRTPDETAE